MFAAKNVNLCGINPPILFDAVGAGAKGALTNPSWSHTLGFSPYGSSLLCVGMNSVSGLPSAVNWAGHSFTRAAEYTFSSGYLTLWYLIIEPTQGGQTGTITVTSSYSYSACGSISYLNVMSLYDAGGASNETAAPYEFNALNGVTNNKGYLEVACFGSSNSGSFTTTSGTQRFNDAYSSGVNYPFWMGDAIAPVPGVAIQVGSPGGDTAVAAAVFSNTYGD